MSAGEDVSLLSMKQSDDLKLPDHHRLGEGVGKWSV